MLDTIFFLQILPPPLFVRPWLERIGNETARKSLIVSSPIFKYRVAEVLIIHYLYYYIIKIYLHTKI